MDSNFKIAVLSGKGGTGKTLISVNLAAVADKSLYIDCDVEEPNGYLFFKPEELITETVSVPLPYIDNRLCTVCRKCVEFCKFNALACVKDRIIIFDEVCHSCGGCKLLCPERAITDKEKIIGVIKAGISENTNILSGFLNIGEAVGIPIIKKLLERPINNSDIVFIDCPPGSACAVMESIKNADYCILAAEPTIFGVHNLNIVYKLLRLFNKPCGVILNKCTEGENPAEIYCRKNNISVLGKIPFEKELGSINSNGEIASRKSLKYKKMFLELFNKLMREVRHEAAVNTQR